MKIIFCGTPAIAIPSLEALARLSPNHELVAVVSQPDKPKGRSGHATPPPIVAAARALGVPAERILQPRSINEPAVLEQLKALAPDLLCVIAYGAILKRPALALPRLMAINAHASLLPAHRGASPIQSALLAGDHETGVTIMKIERGLDCGPILLQRALPILSGDTTSSLQDKLARLSAEAFVQAIELIAAGKVELTPQDEHKATYAPKLAKTSGKIDWSQDALYLERFLRAMNPWPGAWTAAAPAGGAAAVRLRVVRARVAPPMDPAGIGFSRRAVLDGEEVLVVTCGSEALAVQEVQPEGKREMSTAEFLRGAGRKLLPESRWE